MRLTFRRIFFVNKNLCGFDFFFVTLQPNMVILLDYIHEAKAFLMGLAVRENSEVFLLNALQFARFLLYLHSKYANYGKERQYHLDWI